MWSGNFHFRLTNKHQPFEPSQDEDTDDIVSFPISLSFNDPFPLTVDDYNNDGKPDFAISQYGSMSGGDYCAIFTLNDNGIVEILPINSGGERYITMFGMIAESSEPSPQESDTFLIPYKHTDNSPLLEKNEQNGFSVTYRAIHGLEVTHLLDEEVLQSWFDEHSMTTSVRDVYQWKDSAFMLIRQEILDEDGTVWKSSS